MVATTFAEDAVWPTLLNTAISLIQFVMEADQNWSFSRLGTHCLEDFFGLVRRESLGDDRYVTAARIIAKTSQVAMTMHDLNLRVTHRGRDNVGGVVIDGVRPHFEEGEADRIFRSLIHVASLDIFSTEEVGGLLSAEELGSLLTRWAVEDEHHFKDPAYHANFDGKPSNSRIAARLIHPGAESVEPRGSDEAADREDGSGR
jgi:hypothetical protein